MLNPTEINGYHEGCKYFAAPNGYCNRCGAFGIKQYEPSLRNKLDALRRKQVALDDKRREDIIKLVARINRECDGKLQRLFDQEKKIVEEMNLKGEI